MYTKRKSNHHKTGGPLRTLVPALLSVALFGVMIFLVVIPEVEKRLINDKKLLISELVTAGIDTLEYFHTLETQGVFSREQAQAMAWGELSRRRFGPQDKDYLWISSPDGRILKHPYRPDLENLPLGELEAIAPGLSGPGYAIARIVAETGSGYRQYPWQLQDQPGHVVTKLAYVQLFEPWQWVVGAGIYMNDIDKELSSLAKQLAGSGGVVIGIVLLLSIYTVLQMGRLHRESQATWQALSDSEAKHRAVLESAPNPIVVYDDDGRVLFINPAFTRTFGWRADELLGQGIDFVPPENREETQDAIRQAYADPESTHRLETRRRTRSGEVIDVLVSASVFRDANGTAIGMVVNLHDITQIKAVEQALLESEMMSKAIADTARDAIIMIDDHGKITLDRKSVV